MAAGGLCRSGGLVSDDGGDTPGGDYLAGTGEHDSGWTAKGVALPVQCHVPRSTAPQKAQERAEHEVGGIDEQHRPFAPLGLAQAGPELVPQERGLLVGVGLGRDGTDLPPTQAETFFKKARTWVNPRRMPVCSSMAAWASRAERGGCARK